MLRNSSYTPLVCSIRRSIKPSPLESMTFARVAMNLKQGELNCSPDRGLWKQQCTVAQWWMPGFVRIHQSLKLTQDSTSHVVPEGRSVEGVAGGQGGTCFMSCISHKKPREWKTQSKCCIQKRPTVTAELCLPLHGTYSTSLLLQRAAACRLC